MIRKVLLVLFLVGSILGTVFWYFPVRTLMARSYNLTRMWRVFELTNKNWLLVFSLAIIGGCSVYLVYRFLRRWGMRKLSWYLNKIWNLGHNNEDANFDWWEWYGPHIVKRYWKRTMGKYIRELAGSPKSLISLGCGSSPIINMFQSRVVGVEIEPDKVAFMQRHSSAEFIVGDITQMDPMGKFEVVLCNEVLEHLNVDGLTGTIELLTRYLEKDGKLVISFPDYGSWYGRLLERLVHGSLHTKEFTKMDLIDACRRVGLSLVAERRFLWDTCISFQRR